MLIESLFGLGKIHHIWPTLLDARSTVLNISLIWTLLSLRYLGIVAQHINHITQHKAKFINKINSAATVPQSQEKDTVPSLFFPLKFWLHLFWLVSSQSENRHRNPVEDFISVLWANAYDVWFTFPLRTWDEGKYFTFHFLFILVSHQHGKAKSKWIFI